MSTHINVPISLDTFFKRSVDQTQTYINKHKMSCETYIMQKVKIEMLRKFPKNLDVLTNLLSDNEYAALREFLNEPIKRSVYTSYLQNKNILPETETDGVLVETLLYIAGIIDKQRFYEMTNIQTPFIRRQRSEDIAEANEFTSDHDMRKRLYVISEDGKFYKKGDKHIPRKEPTYSKRFSISG